MRSLSGKIALVTGAGGGLGRAISFAFAQEGSHVLAVDINREEAERTADLLLQKNLRCTPFTADMTDSESVSALTERVLADFGHVEVLMNCVGIGAGGRFWQFTLEDWKTVIDTNLWSTLLPIHYLVPHMKERRQGHIATISSAGGLVGFMNVAPYCTTKFALVGLGDCLRSELAGYGIGVTTVCPTAIRTKFIEHSLVKVESEADARRERVLRSIWERSYDPEKAAGIIVNGIKRNKPLILIGFWTHVSYSMKRFAPRIFYWILEASGKLAARAAR